MLSQVRGPATTLLEITIAQQLRETAARFGSRPALISCHQNVRFTWSELDQQTSAWAAGLLALGLVPGDRVGVWSTNCVEWVLLQLACARTGIVLVNVNPAYRSHELAFVMRKSRMRALFLWEHDRRANYAEILAEAKVPEGMQVHFFGSGTFAPVPGADVPDHGVGDDVTNIQYTSGTTGSPKGVLLTHRNILNNGMLAARQMRVDEKDSLCCPVPLYHCFGCVLGVLMCVASGCALILPNWTFDAGLTLEAIHAERATVLYGVPTMFIAQLQHGDFEQFDLTSLRTGIMAGAPCPIEIMKCVISQMHCEQMTIGYGLTEASPLITMSSADDPVEIRVGTVGAAFQETEVKIVDRETGATVEHGVQGELCTRGYLVMKGYDAEEEATRKAIDPEGWLHSGDLALMREDGNFRITGRAKDMIIRGGENIYPREIEEFLYTHPKIADVQVVGLPDVKLGETVAVWIRLKAGESMDEHGLREFCRGKIAHFKVPQHVRFVDDFPMTVTGKIQKFKIRELEIERLGLEEAARITTA
jgi:fatty-acyl-CoA synthase